MTRALVIVALTAACGGETAVDADANTPWCDICPTEDNQYVLDGERLIAAAADVDGDGDSENRLGRLLSTDQDPRLDLPGALGRGVLRGETITLLNLRADSLTTEPDAELWIFLGDDPSPAPCTSSDDRTCGQHLDGSGSFDIALDSPTRAVLGGAIVAGVFQGEPDSVALELWLGAGDPVTLNLIGARVEALVSDNPELLDLDMLDERGDVNPNTDGIADSISFAIDFTGVSASFPRPPE